MIVLFSFLLAFWFKYEFKHFTKRVNHQVYTDYQSLFSIKYDFSSLIKNSTLQPKKTAWENILLLLFPFFAFSIENVYLLFIVLIFTYLALLDICYQLTDIRYIAAIFLLSIWTLLNLPADLLKEYLVNFVFTSVFFSLFLPLTHHFLKKEGLGSGDALLFAALSPLFTFPDMLKLLFLSATFGLIVVGLSRCFMQNQREKWPFIPFIYLAFGMLI